MYLALCVLYLCIWYCVIKAIIPCRYFRYLVSRSPLCIQWPQPVPVSSHLHLLTTFSPTYHIFTWQNSLPPTPTFSLCTIFPPFKNTISAHFQPFPANYICQNSLQRSISFPHIPRVILIPLAKFFPNPYNLTNSFFLLRIFPLATSSLFFCSNFLSCDLGHPLQILTLHCTFCNTKI